MNTTAYTITDAYNLGNLVSLPRIEKLRIIKLLANSLMEGEKEQTASDNWAERFCGAWVDDRSAEEIVADIRDSRTVNRDIISLFEE